MPAEFYLQKVTVGPESPDFGGPGLTCGDYRKLTSSTETEHSSLLNLNVGTVCCALISFVMISCT